MYGFLTKENLYERIPFLKYYEDVSDTIYNNLKQWEENSIEFDVQTFKYEIDIEDANIFIKEKDRYVTLPFIKFVSVVGYSGMITVNEEELHVVQLLNELGPEKPEYMDDNEFIEIFGEWTQNFKDENSFKRTIEPEEDAEKELDGSIDEINKRLFLIEEDLSAKGIPIF